MDSGQRKFKFGIDGALIVVASILLVVSLYFLFSDGSLTNSETSTQKLVAVGKLANRKNDVRRKAEDGFSWSNIREKDTVYEGDSIFTGEESEAQIQLNEGGKIAVDPKSLVVVRTQGNKLRLDLQYGSLVGKVDSSSSIVIKQNGELKELSADGAEIRIESGGKGKETNIQVVSGEVKLRSLSGSSGEKTQVIKQNEVAQLAPSTEKQAVVRKVEVELVSPANGTNLWLPAGKNVDFKWRSVKGLKLGKSKIEFARDVSFESLLSSAEAEGGSYSLPEASRPQGSFSWRVRPLTEGALPSTSARLSVYPDVAPEPTLPNDGQEFAFDVEKGEKGAQVTLNWQDKAGSEDYRVVLAKDQGFKQIVEDKTTRNASMRTPVLPKGIYYWRVQGRHPARKTPPFSDTLKFTVYENFNSIAAPIMKQAEIKYQIPEQIIARLPASLPANSKGVRPEGLNSFEWETVTNAESYEVEVASDKDFANAVKRDVGQETRFAPEEVKPGPMFVRVRAKGPRGIVSEPSTSSRLFSTLPAPVMADVDEVVQKFKTQEELDKGKSEIALTWTARPYADSYELEWGSDASFERSKKFIVKEPKRAISVSKPWQYTARVRALASDGTPISDFSAPKPASYKKELLPPPTPPPVMARVPTPPPVPTPIPPADDVGGLASKAIPSPRLSEPRRNTTVIVMDNSIPFVSFQWKETPNTTYYEVQIAEDPQFKKVIDQLKVNSARFTLQKALPEGRVYWRVRSYRKKEFGEWSTIYDMNVVKQ